MGACSIENVVNCPKEFLNSKTIHSWSERTDSYSGDWNTCSNLKRVVKVFDKCTETNLKKWNTEKKYLKMYEDALDNTPKWSCMAFDLGVVSYEVWTAKKTKSPSKSKPTYKVMFNVYGYDKDDHKVKLASKETQTEADKYASRYTVENGTMAFWVKERVLVSGKEETASFDVVKKSYKSKPKTVKSGSVLREIHKYRVIGIAAM